MKLGRKLVALVTVFLMMFSNVLVFPAAAASTSDRKVRIMLDTIDSTDHSYELSDAHYRVKRWNDVGKFTKHTFVVTWYTYDITSPGTAWEVVQDDLVTGTASNEFEPGHFLIEQVTPPTGYYSNSSTIDTVLGVKGTGGNSWETNGELGRTNEFDVFNNPIRTITINKEVNNKNVDSHDFNIKVEYKNDLEFDWHVRNYAVSADDDYVINLNDLHLDSIMDTHFKISESNLTSAETSAGYVKGSIVNGDFWVNHDRSEVKTVTVNNAQHATIKVIKTETGKPSVKLANAIFQVSKSSSDFSGSNLVATLTTNASGEDTATIDAGSYWIREIDPAPTGYENSNKTPTPITVTGSNTLIAANTFTFTDDKSAPGASGISISATATVGAALTKTNTWTIDKSVDHDHWDLFQGETGVSTYTIAVTKTAGTPQATLSGTVSVKNEGEAATKDLAISVDFAVQGGSGYSLGSVAVDTSAKPNLNPGETYAYPYTYTPSTVPAAGVTVKATANVTITNHSGHLTTPFGPSPSSTCNTGTVTETNSTVHVADTFHPTGSPWTFSHSDSVTYTRTFSASDEGSIVNTATMTNESGDVLGSDSASVTVSSYGLNVSTSMDTSHYSRTYSWTVDKTADVSSPVPLKLGETKDVNYTVSVNATYADSAAASGTVTITNNAPIAAIINASDISASPAISLTLTGISFPYTIPASGGTLTIPYTASMTSVAGLPYTVSAKYKGITYSGNSTITFGSSPDVAYNQHVKVLDTLQGTLASDLDAAAVPSVLPAVYTYKKTLSGNSTINNTAKVVAIDDETNVLASALCSVSSVLEANGNVTIKKVVGNYASKSDFQIVLVGKDDANNTIYNQTLAVPANNTSGVTVTVPVGNYTVSEPTVPSNYELVRISESSFDVTDGSSKTVTVTNQALGFIQIHKMSSHTEQGVAGAQFVVFTKNGETEVPVTLTNDKTDSDGNLVVSGLPLGKIYYAREIAAAPGYNLLHPETTMAYDLRNVAPGYMAESGSFENDPVGSITVNLAMTNNMNASAPISFTITKLDDESFTPKTFELQLPDTASHTESGLLYGTYYVTVTPPAGYSTNGFALNISGGKKIDDNTYEITVGDGDEGSKLAPARKAVTPSASTPTLTVMIEKLYHIGAIKQDAASSSILLAGAEFGIYTTTTGAPVEKITTGKGGTAVSTKWFAPGTYFVKELTPPPGYNLDKSDPVSVTVDASVGTTTYYAPVFTDTRIPTPLTGSLVIKKVDSLDAAKTLSGATFALYYDQAMTAKVGASVTTGTDGIARFDNLPVGSYWLMETAAPTNYDKMTAPISVVVAAGVTNPDPIVIKDQYNPPEDISTGSLIIKKVDSLDSDKALAGATFALYSDQALTKLVGKKTTGADGVARWDALEPGNYWIVETAAPKDYDLMADKLAVTVAASATDPEPIVIKDQYNPPEDISTGMMDWNILLIGGLALLAGLLLVVFNRNRRSHAQTK